MIDYDTLTIWAVILILALGTFVLRFSFLGGIGKRALPEWAMRGLRYTSVAVLPALVVPGIVWPASPGATPEIVRAAATIATIGVGIVSRSVLYSMLAGFGVLWAGLLLT